VFELIFSYFYHSKTIEDKQPISFFHLLSKDEPVSTGREIDGSFGNIAIPASFC